MFTSRLPKSSSVRRPSNLNDGSTSFIGSHIPVSVRKPTNLFTPQNRRSLHSNLASTARKSYMTTEKKYPRPSKPMPDRDEQHRMFDSLIDFLKTNAPQGFLLPEAKRFFSSVSTTEATRIFEFLISFLLPEFKINKLELDVPEALAILDYPYIKSVTKSALVSVTTRQAIINLLVIFDWLVEAIKNVETFSKIETMKTTNTPQGELIKCVLMNPARPIDELKRNLGHLDHSGAAESRSDELERVNFEIDELNEHVREIEELETDKQAILTNIKASDDYIDKMNEHMKLKQEETRGLHKKRLELDNKIQSLKEACEEMDVGLAQCDMGNLDRLREKFNSIEKQIATLDNKKLSTYTEDLRDEQQQMDKIVEIEEKKIARLTEERDRKEKKLQSNRAEFAEKAKLELEYFRGLLETNQQKAFSLIRRAEEMASGWKDVERSAQENNKLVKTALRNLCG